MTYLDKLARELARVGIRGRRRRRILAELADHLSCDPDADIGTPQAIARQFADELGSSQARRAAYGTFAGLAVAGLPAAVAFLSSPQGVFRSATFESGSPLLTLGLVVATVAAQLTFVTGALAALRALVRRREHVIPRTEATVIVRRAAVGLGSGLATMGSLALIAIELRTAASGWCQTLTVSAAGIGAAGLLAAIPAVLAAARVHPVASGSPGDVFDDLGPFAPRLLRGSPWRLALAVAGAVAIAITLAGALQSVGFDGAVRGLADAAASLVGFGVLGRYLGLIAEHG